MLDLVIINGTIVNSSGSQRADIAVKDGKIAGIGLASVFGEASAVIDAFGMYVIPGMIDSHVHIANKTGKFPSEGTYYEGTLAAAYGGTTSVADFAFMFPGETPVTAMERKLSEAAGNCLTDYTFHPYINGRTVGCREEIRQLMRAGFRSVKMFTVYRETHMLPKDALYDILKIVAEENGISLVHAECADIIEANIARFTEAGMTAPRYHALSRPPISETEAMYGILAMVRSTGAPVIFAHMTTSEGRRMLMEAKPNTPVFSEVCPHYLALSDECYRGGDGYKYVCSPPIRSRDDQNGLWEMLADGLVDIISSDHTDYSAVMKAKSKDYFPGIPNGLPTIENRGVVLFSEGVVKGRITMERFVELTSTKAAKLMGLYPRKGILAVGSDADIVIFDPNPVYSLRAADMHMHTDYSPYEGMAVTGRVHSTILRGTPIITEGRFTGTAKRGELLAQTAPILT